MAESLDKLSVEVVAETEAFERAMGGVKERAEGLGDTLKGAGSRLRIGDDVVRETTRAQEKIQQLQQSFRTLKSPNLGADFARETERAMRSADKLQTTMIALQRQAEKPLSTESLRQYEGAVERVRRETEKLEREQLNLRNKQIRGGGGALGGGRGGAVGNIADDVLGAAGLGIPVGAGAAAAVGGGLAAGVLAGKAAYDAGRELERSNRLIASSAKEAGLAYGDLTKKAEAFAKLTGQTKTAGQESFAEITRLAQLAGRAGEVDEIGKGLADVGAARGLKGSELATIARQIIAGEDEGINRLGFANPSKIYEEYAKSIGVASDKLTQQQQIVSILDVVMKKSALFSGDAERQVQSATGQADKFFNTFKDKSAEFGSHLSSLGEPLFRLANNFKASDLLSLGISTGLRADAEKLAQDEKRRWEDVHKYRLKAFQEAQAKIDALAKESADTRTFIEAEAAGKQAEYFQKRLEQQNPNALRFDQVKDFAKLTDSSLASNADYAKLPEDARKKVDEYRRAVEGSAQFEKQQAERRKQEAANFKREQDEAMGKLRERQKLTETFFDSLNSYAGANNPYVKIFGEAETLAARVNEQFKTLGKDAVQEMQRVQAAALEMNRQAERIQTGQRGVGFEYDIKRLQSPQIGLNGEQERQLGVYNKQFDAATQNFGLRREREAYERGGNLSPFQKQSEAFENYERTKRDFGGGGQTLIDAIGRGAKIDPALAFAAAGDPLEQAKQKRADEYVLAETQGLPLNARFSPDARTRQLSDDRQAALRRQEDRNAEEISTEQKRADVGRFAVGEANAKLKDLSKFGGIENDEVRKQYLAVTGALDPKELTPELKMGRIKAVQEEAKQDAAKEKNAEILIKTLIGKDAKDGTGGKDGLIAKLLGLITEQGLKVQSGDKQVILELHDKTGDYELLPRAPEFR